MTNPTTPTPALSKPPASQPAAFSWGRAILTLIFRLLLLGVGGSLAAAVGIAVAQLYPAQTQEPPLVEKLLQSSETVLDNVKQIPKTWTGQEKQTTAPEASPATPAPQPLSTTSLSDNERQQLQTELTQLQAELQTLTSNSSEPLADRVQEIQKRIQAIQEKLSTFSTSPTASPAANQTFVAPATSRSANGERLMVTLPSDALFDGEQTTLRPGTEAILNNILTDLQGYPQATIQVGAHTDDQGSPEANRARSLEQAKAVQQYLSTQLGEDIHWVTVGYGHNQPLASDDTPENQQRNRRIEITIDP